MEVVSVGEKSSGKMERRREGAEGKEGGATKWLQDRAAIDNVSQSEKIRRNRHECLIQ